MVHVQQYHFWSRVIYGHKARKPTVSRHQLTQNEDFVTDKECKHVFYISSFGNFIIVCKITTQYRKHTLADLKLVSSHLLVLPETALLCVIVAEFGQCRSYSTETGLKVLFHISHQNSRDFNNIQFAGNFYKKYNTRVIVVLNCMEKLAIHIYRYTHHRKLLRHSSY